MHFYSLQKWQIFLPLPLRPPCTKMNYRYLLFKTIEFEKSPKQSIIEYTNSWQISRSPTFFRADVINVYFLLREPGDPFSTVIEVWNRSGLLIIKSIQEALLHSQNMLYPDLPISKNTNRKNHIKWCSKTVRYENKIEEILHKTIYVYFHISFTCRPPKMLLEMFITSYWF